MSHSHDTLVSGPTHKDGPRRTGIPLSASLDHALQGTSWRPSMLARAVALAGLLAAAACGKDDRPERAPDPSSEDDDADGAGDDEDADDVGDDDSSSEEMRAGDRDASQSSQRDSATSVMRDAAVIRDAGAIDAAIDPDLGTDAGSTTSDAAASGERAPAITLDFPTMKESPMVAPHFNVYRPTDLSVTGKPLPVVLWANGGCFRAEDTWKQLFDRWAKSGFVVLALSAAPGPLGALMQSTVSLEEFKSGLSQDPQSNAWPSSPHDPDAMHIGT